jgi:hypothetical protein
MLVNVFTISQLLAAARSSTAYCSAGQSITVHLWFIVAAVLQVLSDAVLVIEKPPRWSSTVLVQNHTQLNILPAFLHCRCCLMQFC